MSIHSISVNNASVRSHGANPTDQGDPVAPRVVAPKLDSVDVDASANVAAQRSIGTEKPSVTIPTGDPSMSALHVRTRDRALEGAFYHAVTHKMDPKAELMRESVAAYKRVAESTSNVSTAVAASEYVDAGQRVDRAVSLRSLLVSAANLPTPEAQQRLEAALNDVAARRLTPAADLIQSFVIASKHCAESGGDPRKLADLNGMAGPMLEEIAKLGF
jgi:hypothetical protein